MDVPPICVDCKRDAPDTNSDYTLISSAGWRLARGRAADGTFSLQWRCPACWAKHKEQFGLQSGSWPRAVLATDDAAFPASTDADPHSKKPPKR